MTFKKFAAALALASALFSPIGAGAQDTAATGQSTDLALGEEVIDGLVVGSIYTKEEFGDWQMRCVRAADGRDPCQLYQLMQDENGNSVAEISLFQLNSGGAAVAGATVITPLDTLLTEQLTLTIDGGSTKRYPFRWCSTQGCFSRIGLTAEGINGFKRGSSAQLSIVPVAAPDKRVTLNLSLSGFTAGYDAVIAANAGN